MKLSTFCKICKKTLSWGYYQIKRGNIVVDIVSTPYRITGISLSLYSELKQKGLLDDTEPKEMEYIKSIIF